MTTVSQKQQQQQQQQQKNKTKKKRKSKKKKWKKKNQPIITTTVRTVSELQQQVVNNRIPLKDIEIKTTKQQRQFNATTVTPEQLALHPVVSLMAERYRTKSTPYSRSQQEQQHQHSQHQHLALAIEGGGMRGAVSAGMAAAVCSLGLLETIDSVYGSSAGCIVGAYMVSRQMCVDCYTQVLPAAGPLFACQKRVLRNVGVGYLQDLYRRYMKEPLLFRKKKYDLKTTTSSPSPVWRWPLSKEEKSIAQESLAVSSTEQQQLNNATTTTTTATLPPMNLDGNSSTTTKTTKPSFSFSPGMNISFVIDGIMNGVRPFDMEAFRQNNPYQPLHAVSSTYRNGTFETVAFNANDGDFWDILVEDDTTDDSNTEQQQQQPKRRRRRRSYVTQAVRKILYYATHPILFRARHNRQARPKTTPHATTTTTTAEAVAESILNETLLVRQETATVINNNNNQNKYKGGFFACLESSMNVPGVAVPPLQLLRSKDRQPSEASITDYLQRRSTVANVNNPEQTIYQCFDAFCYEPIPYRSAVASSSSSAAATHVLCLRTRPDVPEVLDTSPKTYETVVAPNYFRKHRLPEVATYFEQQGAQYRYVEDVMTLDEGLVQGCTTGEPVAVPPTTIIPRDDDKEVVDFSTWNKAHLLPLVCKAGVPELPSLTQDKEEVIEAVRNGFVAAFDLLAPIVLSEDDLQQKLPNSYKIAELVFPMDDYLTSSPQQGGPEAILTTPVQIKGDIIQSQPDEDDEAAVPLHWRQRTTSKRKRILDVITKLRRRRRQQEEEEEESLPEEDTNITPSEAILATLPGFQNGRMAHLAGPLLVSSLNNDKS